jgi:hypothetical protein
MIRGIILVIVLAAGGLFAWYYFTKTDEKAPAGERAQEAARELKNDVRDKTHDVAAAIEEKTRRPASGPATQP